MDELSKDDVYNLVSKHEPISFPDLKEEVYKESDMTEEEVSHKLSEHLSDLIDRNRVSTDIDWKYRTC